jgi:GT2 family glycosyltransferase
MVADGAGASATPPRVSLITAVYDPPLDAFADTARSVLGQTHTDWEWVLVDDRSPNPEVRAALRRLAEQDARVRVVERPENGGIVAASSDALAAARGEFVGLLDHDDVLETHALETMVAAVEEHPEADYLYSDQDRMRVDGAVHAPFLKPDWSPERLRHHMYCTHFSFLRRELALSVGGFRAGYDGSQDHDLVLRVTEQAREVVHVPEVLYHWREVPGSAAGDADAKPWAWDAGVRAVQDHLDRVGIPATASKGRAPGTYQVTREPDLETSVSVVIPTIGSSGVVRGEERVMVVETVRSVLAATEHQGIEFVVVYDDPTPPAVLEQLRALPWGRHRLTLVPFHEPFNYSRKNNLGALRASGDVLLFLNDDMEAESPGVVEQLIAPLREEGVGATGAKLLFESSRIQHAGLIYGSGTITHSYYRAAHPAALGAYGELFGNREVTALTGACVAVRREVFEAAGGFTEELPVNYNDVDFSLKVRHLGLRLVWLHAAVLFHFESISRDSAVRDWEKEFITDRWGDYTQVRETLSTNIR